MSWRTALEAHFDGSENPALLADRRNLGTGQSSGRILGRRGSLSIDVDSLWGVRKGLPKVPDESTNTGGPRRSPICGTRWVTKFTL